MSARSFELFGTKKRFGNVTIDRADISGTGLTYIGVILHKTRVVRLIFKDSVPVAVSLTNGGWPTPTTVTAINTALELAGLNGVLRAYNRRGCTFLDTPMETLVIDGGDKTLNIVELKARASVKEFVSEVG
jgi:hypothetical protein